MRRPGWSRARTIAATAAGVLALAIPSGAAAAASSPTVPSEFGSDWANPRTAAPPVPVPDTKHCSVTIVDHGFAGYDPYRSSYAPPADCAGPWAKVVLRMDGAVKGRQYDRIGDLSVGGVTFLRTSTPEPSTDGIAWHVEKDVTDYASVLRTDQPVVMNLGNTVNDTYTGVLDIKVTLDFYVAGPGVPAASTPDTVLPLAGQHRDGSALVGSVTVPRNTERLVAQVYATGSGGGCEEFWYTSAPASTGYSCADGSPYREVQVSVDGKVAGIAAPYPHIYTGGWSNPYLWSVVPAPRAFDIRPTVFDLTPFVGTLTDGKAHEVSIDVLGLPANQSGWALLPDLLVWQDAGSNQVTGSLTSYDVSAPAQDFSVTGHDDLAGSTSLDATRSMRVTGVLHTSHGSVQTTVARDVSTTSRHSWTDAESHDTLDATWHDTSTVTTREDGRQPRMQRAALEYVLDGTIDFTPHPGIDGAYDITTTMDQVADRGTWTTTGLRGKPGTRKLDDTWTGAASWIYNVPRDQRHATGWSDERYRLSGDAELGCYQHEIATRNGAVTLDREHC